MAVFRFYACVFFRCTSICFLQVLRGRLRRRWRQTGHAPARRAGPAATGRPRASSNPRFRGHRTVALLSSRRRRDPLPSPRAGGPASSPPHRRFTAPPPTAPPACGATASVGCQRRRILAACGHVGGATLCERTGSSSPGVCAPETAVCTTAVL